MKLKEELALDEKPLQSIYKEDMMLHSKMIEAQGLNDLAMQKVAMKYQVLFLRGDQKYKKNQFFFSLLKEFGFKENSSLFIPL